MSLDLFAQVYRHSLLEGREAFRQGRVKVVEPHVHLLLEVVQVRFEAGDGRGCLGLTCFEPREAGIQAGQFGVIGGLGMGGVLNGLEDSRNWRGSALDCLGRWVGPLQWVLWP